MTLVLILLVFLMSVNPRPCLSHGKVEGPKGGQEQPGPRGCEENPACK